MKSTPAGYYGMGFIVTPSLRNLEGSTNMPMKDGSYVPLTRTKIENVQEWLQDGVDWSYSFKKNWSSTATDKEGWEKQIDLLKAIEQSLKDGKKVYASNYGGWPRLWSEVLSIGMAAHWPRWKPCPVVVVNQTLGSEWIDWDSLVDVS